MYDDGSPWVLRGSTIRAYLRDRYDPTIPKLCPDPFQDKLRVFKIRITVKKNPFFIVGRFKFEFEF